MVYKLIVYDFEYCHRRADRRMNNSRAANEMRWGENTGIQPAFSPRPKASAIVRLRELCPYPLSARTDKEAPS